MIRWQDIHGIDTACPYWQDAVWNLLRKHYNNDDETLVHEVGVEMARIVDDEIEMIKSQQEHMIDSWEEEE